MTRSLILAVLLAPSAFAAPSPLIGVWYKNGAPYAELPADGKGQVGGENVAWKADGKTLRLVYASGEVEVMFWKLSGNKLSVSMDGQTDVLTRGESKAAAPAAKGAKAPPAEKAGNDKLSTMLLSSAWCHFRYNKVSGTSHQERVVFRRDGTWDSGARGESYSSGAYGTAAGQTDSSSGGRWKVKGSSLLMSEGGGALEDAELKVTRNSNGYPILNAGGKEYSSCN